MLDVSKLGDAPAAVEEMEEGGGCVAGGLGAGVPASEENTQPLRGFFQYAYTSHFFRFCLGS